MRRPEPERVELPVFDPPPGGRGMLVDITDKPALWEALDDDGPR